MGNANVLPGTPTGRPNTSPNAYELKNTSKNKYHKDSTTNIRSQKDAEFPGAVTVGSWLITTRHFA